MIQVEKLDDIRTKIPGSFWVFDDKIETNIKINYDANNDLPALFGIYTNDAISQAYKNVNSYAGTVWQLSDSSITIITIDFWNETKKILQNYHSVILEDFLIKKAFPTYSEKDF